MNTNEPNIFFTLNEIHMNEVFLDEIYSSFEFRESKFLIIGF